MKKLVVRYVGPLDSQSVADGILASTGQARQLLEDALLLFDAGRFSTAAALAALSTEESAKALMLPRIAAANDEAKRRSAWRELRTHSLKARHLRGLSLLLAGALSEGKLNLNAENYINKIDDPSMSDEYLSVAKELGLYADCFGVNSPSWSKPSDAIERPTAELYIAIAKAYYTLVSKTSKTREALEIAIDLLKWSSGPRMPSPREFADYVGPRMRRVMELADADRPYQLELFPPEAT